MRKYIRAQIPIELHATLVYFKPELKTNMAKYRELNKILEQLIYGNKKK